MCVYYEGMEGVETDRSEQMGSAARGTRWTRVSRELLLYLLRGVIPNLYSALSFFPLIFGTQCILKIDIGWDID